MSDATESLSAFLPFSPTPDRDSKPYWQALAEGSFRLQRCSPCSTLRWPPRALCNRCRSFDHEWENIETRGEIVSWVRTHQAFAPALREAVPYWVVQVALIAQRDVLLIGGWLVDREPRPAESVEMQIVEGAEGFRFPCWKPNA
jgi:uncharacterized OB-fold protein